MRLHHVTPEGAIERCTGLRACRFMGGDHYTVPRKAEEALVLMEARGYRTYALEKEPLRRSSLSPLRGAARETSLECLDEVLLLGELFEELLSERVRFSLEGTVTLDERKSLQAALRGLFSALAPPCKLLPNCVEGRLSPGTLGFLPGALVDLLRDVPLRVENEGLKKRGRPGSHSSFRQPPLPWASREAVPQGASAERVRGGGHQVLAPEKLLTGRLAKRAGLKPSEQEALYLHEYCHLLQGAFPEVLEAAQGALGVLPQGALYSFEDGHAALFELPDTFMGKATGEELFPSMSEALWCPEGSLARGPWGKDATPGETFLRTWALGLWVLLALHPEVLSPEVPSC